MSEADLSSIFSMKFYRKKPQWASTPRSHPDLPTTSSTYPPSGPSEEKSVQGTQTTNHGSSALNESIDQNHNEVSSHNNEDLGDEIVDSWIHAAMRSRDRDVLAEADGLLSESSFNAGASIVPQSLEFELGSSEVDSRLRLPSTLEADLSQRRSDPSSSIDVPQDSEIDATQQRHQSYVPQLLHSCADLVDWPENERRLLAAMEQHQLTAYAQRELLASERHRRRHAHLATIIADLCNYQGEHYAQHVLVNQQHAPSAQQHAPINQQHAPVNQQLLVNQQHAPSAQQHAPVNQQHAPIIQMYATVDEQHALVNQQHAPSAQQHAPINQQHAPINPQLTTVNQVYASVNQQHAPIIQMYASVNQQHAPINQPSGRGRGRFHPSPNPTLLMGSIPARLTIDGAFQFYYK